MPLPDNQTLLAAVEQELAALEQLCGRLEGALMRRGWNELGHAIADSRRVTHALANAMEAAQAARTPQFDEQVRLRLARVHAIRQNQMARIGQYRDAVGERLRLLSRWKAALKAIGAPRRTSRLASLDQLT